jgi:hypothetical protein
MFYLAGVIFRFKKTRMPQETKDCMEINRTGKIINKYGKSSK